MFGLMVVSVFFWVTFSTSGTINTVLHTVEFDSALQAYTSEQSGVDVSKSSAENEQQNFSVVVHQWIEGPIAEFQYESDFSELKNTDQISLIYSPEDSSVKIKPQRIYFFAKLYAIISLPVLSLCILIMYLLHRSKLYIVYRLERIALLSSISLLTSLPFLFVFWKFTAERLSTYPQAHPIAMKLVVPLANELLLRYAIISLSFFAFYFLLYQMLKRVLRHYHYEPPHQHKKRNDLLWSSTKLGRMYIKKVLK